MSVKVVFTHDDNVKKWECRVENVSDQTEARQAFMAVVLTCQKLNPSLLKHTKVDERHNITPAV